MTKASIEHAFEFVKRDFGKIPDKVFFALSEHKGVGYKVAAQILRETPEKAYDHLRVLGYDGDFPVALCNLSEFYGIRPKYLKHVLATMKVGARTTPTVFGKYPDGTVFVDPRVALASSVVMLHGRTVPHDMTVEHIRDRLFKSTYYEAAIHQEEPEVKDNDAVIDGVTVFQDGSFTMTMEFFQNIIQHIAKEAASNAVNATVKRTTEPQQKTHDTRPKGKPKNWDKIVELYDNKKLTGAEAASAVGMSPATFYRYKAMTL